MDVNDLHPPDDYSHRFFIWHEWIQANGPLTHENVFDYFATSMFYDKQSNNQVLRMQTMHTGMPILNEAEELRRFTGVEFALVHAQPPTMFIIQKRERLSPDEVRPLAAYFIMNNRIYQSPDIYTVLSNRLLTSLSSLQSSLDILRTHRPDYTPRTGFVWPIMDPTMQEESAKKKASEDDTNTVTETTSGVASIKRKALGSTEPPKRQQNNTLLLNAMRATAAHAKASLPSNTFSANSDSLMVDTPAPHISSSATPAPTPSQSATPKNATNVPSPQEITKVPPGGGKKKRKRL
ncbi:MED6 mediator sub complex component-domain-containing protein [Collybia nuda]|uniref:Mediator of RNA polymerase II transcription subunit 6 n=1 Tax=Collybia nuda TaxID=64659 RepID=A0A9P5XYJ5_9AGAR|nr:MED6 mediator sub complex component-domain-containing protein [Collybia nuda]